MSYTTICPECGRGLEHAGDGVACALAAAQPDPRDARIAAGRRDAVRAEVTTLHEQVTTCRLALEFYAQHPMLGQEASEALAALDRNISSHDVTAAIDHSINQGSIETGANPVQSDPECAALLRVAEAAEAALAGHGPFLTPYESRIVNALADLAEVRKVRKGGRDG